MKLFLWTNKLLFLITQNFLASVFVIMNFIDLSLNRSDKSYYELINVCNIYKALTSTFVLVWVGHFHGFLIVPSWEFHGPLELASPMKYMLGCNCLFRGHEMYQSKVYVTFMTHENLHSRLCKLFIVHENNW